MMMAKSNRVKVGVLGARRGQTMIDVLAKHPDGDIVAICDANQQALSECKANAEKYGSEVTFYTDFDHFLEHDLDAVVLANYATEHAPYAIKVLDSGRHVYSEVLACETMAEAVALIEAVERNRKIYTYAENYCYTAGIFEMRRLYKSGSLGEFLHGECEYIHDCESIWPNITYGNKKHWRNWVPSTFYCSHSIGPVMFITGLRPVRVTAYETPNVNSRRFGRLGSDGSMIICKMSNGGIAKFIPWSNYKREPSSIWCAIYGSKGMVETNRWHDLSKDIFLYTEESKELKEYCPEPPCESELAQSIKGHGGSDFYTIQYFLDAILDRPGKENIIDVYHALDMTIPGILGYKSICEGNAALEMPDFHDKNTRDAYRNDNWCLDPKYAGPGQPDCSTSFGPVEIDNSVYETTVKRYQETISQK